MKEGGRNSANHIKLQTIKSRAVRREPRKNHEKNLKSESLPPTIEGPPKK